MTEVCALVEFPSFQSTFSSPIGKLFNSTHIEPTRPSELYLNGHAYHLNHHAHHLNDHAHRNGHAYHLNGHAPPLNDDAHQINVHAHHLIADHYRARCNRRKEDREKSPIVELKKLHSCIKGVLIRSYTREGDAVLDLACGKGGDLARWARARVRAYVGVDVVEGLVEVAREKFRGMQYRVKERRKKMMKILKKELAGEKQKQTQKKSINGFMRGTFSARFMCADAYSGLLREDLRRGGLLSSFHVCSCQFALHYAWSSVDRATLALSNVAALLKPGGYFIGTIPDADVILRRLAGATAGHVAAGCGATSGHKVAAATSAGLDDTAPPSGAEFGNEVYRVKFDAANCSRALMLAADRNGAEAGHVEAAEAASHVEAYGIQYEFYLEDAVDHCPEWLVPIGQLTALAQQFGLELLSSVNFHDLMEQHASATCLAASTSTISPSQWECVSLYRTFVFRKLDASFDCRLRFAMSKSSFLPPCKGLACE